jgi:calcineurin-like phosphoesterase family protein
MILLSPSNSRESRHPRIPDGVRIYAVGDIHGRADLLDGLLSRIDSDQEKAQLSFSIEIFVGDYVDRGPDSRQVLERLIARKRTHRVVCLKGNHEIFLAEFTNNPAILGDWQRIGGLETLMSYGLAPSINADAVVQAELAAALDQAMPQSHRQFLGELKSSFTFGDFYFVHAGVRPGVPLANQREQDLLWIRNEFLHCEDDFGKIIVHGHTPVPQIDIRPNRINIDTGAYATGNLSCLVLQDETVNIV